MEGVKSFFFFNAGVSFDKESSLIVGLCGCSLASGIEVLKILLGAVPGYGTTSGQWLDRCLCGRSLQHLTAESSEVLA